MIAASFFKEKFVLIRGVCKKITEDEGEKAFSGDFGGKRSDLVWR